MRVTSSSNPSPALVARADPPGELGRIPMGRTIKSLVGSPCFLVKSSGCTAPRLSCTWVILKCHGFPSLPPQPAKPAQISQVHRPPASENNARPPSGRAPKTNQARISPGLVIGQSECSLNACGAASPARPAPRSPSRQAWERSERCPSRSPRSTTAPSGGVSRHPGSRPARPASSAPSA